MVKYIPLVIAVLTLISIILAGFFHVLPGDTVDQIVVAIITFIIGHISAPPMQHIRNRVHST